MADVEQLLAAGDTEALELPEGDIEVGDADVGSGAGLFFEQPASAVTAMPAHDASTSALVVLDVLSTE